MQSAADAGMRDYDGDLQQNSYWVSELSSHAELGWSFGSILEHPARRATMTLAQLREACATFIRTDAYVHLTMRPGR